MQTEQKFWINCVPPKSTHQSALRIFKMKNGRQFIGRDSKGLAVDRMLQKLLLPFKPSVPLDSAIDLSIRWVFPYRKNEPKKNRQAPLPCITRPDADNLTKGLLDAMTKVGFWKDDSLIFRIQFEKLFSENSGIGVIIRTNSGSPTD